MDYYQRIRKYLLPAAAAIICIALFWRFFMASVEVAVATPKRKDLTGQAFGNGTVEARIVVKIASKITGRVVSLHTDQGKAVRRGEILAKLDSEEFEKLLLQATATVGKAGAVESLEGANLRKAGANYELAERNAARYRSLAKDSLVSRIEVEQFENIAAVAKEELGRARGAVEASRQDGALSRAALDTARVRLADTNIYAPRDGVILSRDVEAGTVVTPGQSIFTLADPSTVWVKASIDEALLGGLKVGQPATVTLRSAPETPLAAKVSRIGTQSDRTTEELEVNVTLDTALPEFRIGEQAELLVTTSSAKSALTIPATAVVLRENQRGVWLATGGRVTFRGITTGIEDRSGVIQVLNGLAENEEFVLLSAKPGVKLREGARVKVRR